MTLSQVQIIRSLGEALSWFERELSWGVSPSSLPHLTGRIGELYAAMVTRGQMALATNQRGYDVVSAEGERVSVKTITTSTHVTFNHATFDQVDRVIILRILVEENEASIEELLDCPAVQARETMRLSGDKILYYPNARLASRNLSDLSVTAHAMYEKHSVKQLENGTILVEANGSLVEPALPVLRTLASQVRVVCGRV